MLSFLILGKQSCQNVLVVNQKASSIPITRFTIVFFPLVFLIMVGDEPHFHDHSMNNEHHPDKPHHITQAEYYRERERDYISQLNSLQDSIHHFPSHRNSIPAINYSWQLES